MVAGINQNQFINDNGGHIHSQNLIMFGQNLRSFKARSIDVVSKHVTGSFTLV